MKNALPEVPRAQVTFTIFCLPKSQNSKEKENKEKQQIHTMDYQLITCVNYTNSNKTRSDTQICTK